MDIIAELKYVLEASKNNQNTDNSIPAQLSDIDEKINEILDYWTNVNQEERGQILKFITVDIAWFLFCFGIKMATYSLRLSNQRYFTNGLLAIGMTLGILDTRDIWVILPLFCDAQKKTGLSFDEILGQNSDFSSELKDFINRDEKDKTLECMGYILDVDENNNPTYKRTW